MTKTVKELADELGVSRQRVQQVISKQVASKRPDKLSGKYQIDSKSEALIRKKISPEESKKEKANKSKYGASSRDKIAAFESQLDKKDQQILEKDKQIQELHKLLDQSQQLQLMAENKIKRLENNSTQNGASEGDTLANNEEDSTTKGERGFWSRLFNRRN